MVNSLYGTRYNFVEQDDGEEQEEVEEGQDAADAGNLQLENIKRNCSDSQKMKQKQDKYWQPYP